MKTFTTTSISNSEKVIIEIEKRIEEIKKKINGQDVDVIEITLPPINSKHLLSIYEDIHNAVYAERIGKKLFIKLDSGTKTEVHGDLKDKLKNQLPNTWWIQNKITCVVNRDVYLPDIGAWPQRPTQNQRTFPIIYSCPPPLIWIEVVYNRKKDCEHAMTNIQLAKSHCTGTEFLIVTLVLDTKPYQANPNPKATSVSVGVPLKVQPYQGPYIGYWTSYVTYNAVRWYKISWNQYLDIGYNVCIDFNVILNLLIEDSEENVDEDNEEDNNEDNEKDNNEDNKEENEKDDEEDD